MNPASAEGVSKAEMLWARFRNRWVPQKIELPVGTDDWLRQMLPGLDPGAIDWCLGLPWFLGPGTWVKGMALPHPWKPGRVRIYLRQWNPDDPDGLSLVVHEAVHAWQIQRAAQGGICIGYWHPFLSAYLASWTRHGYRHHPLELPAYAFEAEFDDQAWAYPNPDYETDATQLALLAPPGLICPDPWPGYQDAAWRMLLWAGILPSAAILAPLIELMARLLFSLGKGSRTRSGENNPPS